MNGPDPWTGANAVASCIQAASQLGVLSRAHVLPEAPDRIERAPQHEEVSGVYVGDVPLSSYIVQVVPRRLDPMRRIRKVDLASGRRYAVPRDYIDGPFEVVLGYGTIRIDEAEERGGRQASSVVPGGRDGTVGPRNNANVGRGDSLEKLVRAVGRAIVYVDKEDSAVLPAGGKKGRYRRAQVVLRVQRWDDDGDGLSTK